MPTPAYYTDQGPSESVDENGNIEDYIIEDTSKYYQTNFQENYATFSYYFPRREFINSTASHSCLESVRLISGSENHLIINTSKGNSCFDYYDELDELNINIELSSDYEIINSNADLKNNNTHTWKINRNNYQDKFIQLEYAKKVPVISPEENPTEEPTPNSKPDLITYVLVIGAVSVFLVGIVGVIIYKSSNS